MQIHQIASVLDVIFSYTTMLADLAGQPNTLGIFYFWLTFLGIICAPDL
jgi:hypothetical protein